MITKYRKPAIHLLLAVTTVLMLAAVRVQTARAMEIDGDGRVGADEVVNDDLILSGNDVQMAGTVNGNLVATGSTVLVSGTVNGDLLVFGSMVTVTGTVNGNVFSAGGEVVIEGKVEDSLVFVGNSLILASGADIGSNLYAAGFSIGLDSGSRVFRDAALAGYQVIVNGDIGRDVRAGAEAFELTGSVGRNVTVDIGESDQDAENTEFLNYMPFPHVGRIVAPGLHVSSEAVIGGELEYYSSVDQSAGIQATPEGGVVYHYRARTDSEDYRNVRVNTTTRIRTIDFAALFMNYVFGVIREFLTLILLGALAVWLIPSLLNRSAGMLRAKPLPSLGWGLIVLIVGLIALVLAAFLVFMLGLAVGVVTLFGLMSAVFGIGFSAIGLSGALFLAIAQYGSKLVVALLIGDLIIRLFRRDYSASSFWPLLLGILLMVLVDAVPILGGIVSFFVILFGLGAIWLIFRNWWLSRSAKA
jgi:hypothetical protein